MSCRAIATIVPWRYRRMSLILRMDSLSLGMPARFQKCGEATFNYPYNNHSIGHDGRGIAVTIPWNLALVLSKIKEDCS